MAINQELKFVAKWTDAGLKRGAKEAADSLTKMRQQMEFTANMASQKFAASQEKAAQASAAAQRATDNFKQSLAFASVAMGVAVVAGKKLYQAIGEGAQIELAGIRFDRLATSIGTTGDALREDLADATDGLMSDADQMALATDLMSLGLAKTHDQAVRLTSVASQLGMNMNQLVLTLTNRTTMRFDALGVAVDGFDEKVKILEESGLSVEDAFTEAFLQQAEAQIERVGSVAETSAGKIMRFEATIENFGNSLKVLAAESFVPLLDNFTTLTELRQEGAINFLQQDFLMWANAIGIAEGRTEELVEELEKIKDKEEVEGALQDYQTGLEDLAQAAREGVDPLYDLAEANDEVTRSLDDANLSLDSFITKTQDQIMWLESGGGALQEAAQAIKDNYVPGVSDAEEALASLRVIGIETIVTMNDMNAMSLDQLEGEFEDLGYDIDVARRLALAVYNGVKSIDGLVANATINIETNGSIPNIVGNQVSGGGGGAFQQAPIPAGISGPQQAGGDFIVPPQFSNDSGLVRVSAGERVKVDTASNTQQAARTARLDRKRENRELAEMITQGILIGLG